MKQWLEELSEVQLADCQAKPRRQPAPTASSYQLKQTPPGWFAREDSEVARKFSMDAAYAASRYDEALGLAASLKAAGGCFAREAVDCSARCYLALDNWQAAAAELAALLAAFPVVEPGSQHFAATAYLRMGMPQAALPPAKQFAVDRPSTYQAWLLLAAAFAGCGQLGSAAACQARAQALAAQLQVCLPACLLAQPAVGRQAEDDCFQLPALQQQQQEAEEKEFL